MSEQEVRTLSWHYLLSFLVQRFSCFSFGARQLERQMDRHYPQIARVKSCPYMLHSLKQVIQTLCASVSPSII